MLARSFEQIGMVASNVLEQIRQFSRFEFVERVELKIGTARLSKASATASLPNVVFSSGFSEQSIAVVEYKLIRKNA